VQNFVKSVLRGFCTNRPMWNIPILWPFVSFRSFLSRDVTQTAVVVASRLGCPSVRLSLCDVKVTWSYKLEFLENNYARLISLTFPLSADPNITDLLQREHPQILSGIGVGCEKIGPVRTNTKPPIYPKRLKTERKLLLTAYIKSYTGFRLPPKCMTLNDL